MSNTISEFLLTQVINYGAPLFALNLFLGAIGLPIGASFTLIAVGAFAQQGYFSWIEMSLFGLAGALLGDAISFGMGYYQKDWTQRRFGKSPLWMNARSSFQQHAGLAVFLTRFLITGLAVPTNLIAGGSGYKFSRFMLYDMTGETTWVFLYGGLGYLFGSQWEEISQIISDFGSLILGVVILIAGIALARKWLINNNSSEQTVPG